MTTPFRSVTISLTLVALATVVSVRFADRQAGVAASDHIDSPTITQDRGADLGDSWSFLDPNDNNRVVIVLTTQNFMTQGEAPNKAIFDPNLRYRIEIENTGDARPDSFIDVRYSRGNGRGVAQTATISVPGGRSFTALTTVATLGDTSPAQVVTTDPGTSASFFAGQAEDPFFLDNTALGRFAESVMMGAANPLLLTRGRDTYAGYNVLATIVSLPVSLLAGSTPVIGINTVTQRQRVQFVREGEVFGSGEWVNVDRDGFPFVNNALMPATRKNEFNSASTVDDANGRFQADIATSLTALGGNPATVNGLLDLFVRRGDFMRLDIRIPNTGPRGGTNPQAAFPNGRRLADDAVDIFLTRINNGVTRGDNVNANDGVLRSVFPFVGDSLQPFPSGTLDDLTRN